MVHHFNAESEYRKLQFKLHSFDHAKRILFPFCLLIIVVSIIYFTYASYTISGTYNVTNATVASFTQKTYTINLDANGGSVSPNTISVPNNSAYGTLPTPVWVGHTFNGWFTATTGGTQVTSATVYQKSEGNITIHAQWTQATYTITYNGNGGTPSSSTQNITYGATYGTLPTATRDSNYFFGGWTTVSSSSFDYVYYYQTYSDLYNAFGTDYSQLHSHYINYGFKEGRKCNNNQVTSNTTYTANNNQTLYALWLQNPVYAFNSGSYNGTYLSGFSNTSISNNNITLTQNVSANGSSCSDAACCESATGTATSNSNVNMSTFNFITISGSNTYSVPYSGSTSYSVKLNGATVALNTRTSLSSLGIDKNSVSIALSVSITNCIPWTNWYSGSGTLSIGSIYLEP